MNFSDRKRVRFTAVVFCRPHLRSSPHIEAVTVPLAHLSRRCGPLQARKWLDSCALADLATVEVHRR